MALTKVSRGILNTGVADSSDATAITINSSENVTLAGTLGVTGVATFETHIVLGDDDEIRLGANTDITLKHHNSGYGHLQNTGTLYIDAEVLSFRTDNSNIGERLNINAAGVAAFASAVTWSGGGSANANTAYTVANAALPKAGGIMTGTLQLNDVAQSIDFIQSGAINFDSDADQTGRSLIIGSNRAAGVSGGTTNVTFYEDGSSVFNEASIDSDFRIESDCNANMLCVNGGTDRVGVGTSGPTAPLEVSESFGGAVGSTKVRITSRHTAAHVGQAHLDFAYVDDGNVAVPNVTASIRSISSIVSPTDVGGILVFATKAAGGATTDLPVENFRIAVNGDLTATDTSIGSNSDSRLKKNIESYTYDISKFKSYSPKKFDWINPTQHGDRSQQIGFIAQEQEIVDERFTGSITLDAGDGIENNPDVSLVDEDRIVKTSKFGQVDAMYISVIQQLITRLETAEARIADLEA